MGKILSMPLVTSWIATVLIISNILVFYHNYKNTVAASGQKDVINGISQETSNFRKTLNRFLKLPVEDGPVANNNVQAPIGQKPSEQNGNININDAIPTASTTPTNTPTPGPTPTPNPGITAAQVATHNSSSNCWLIISNQVYNLTSFLNIHSGGASVITPYCGKDATTYFLNKHPQGSYINYLVTHLYYQGNLASTAPNPTPPTPINTSTPTPVPTNGPIPTPGITPITYTANIANNGAITPSALTIATNDTIKFVYSGEGDEIVLKFSPNPPNNIKLDHEKTQASYKFTQSGLYTVQINGTTRLNITVN